MNWAPQWGHCPCWGHPQPFWHFSPGWPQNLEGKPAAVNKEGERGVNSLLSSQQSKTFVCICTQIGADLSLGLWSLAESLIAADKPQKVMPLSSTRPALHARGQISPQKSPPAGAETAAAGIGQVHHFLSEQKRNEAYLDTTCLA